MGWRDQAVCNGADTEIFFDNHRRKLALSYCKVCPVTAECLKAAMAEEDTPDIGSHRNRGLRNGVRGGLLAEQRWVLAYPEESAVIKAREVIKNRARRERERLERMSA